MIWLGQVGPIFIVGKEDKGKGKTLKRILERQNGKVSRNALKRRDSRKSEPFPSFPLASPKERN
ncbi:hypothetical protein Fmac_031060 [Flemingia macrophylla]|uniref:Uncharacterized protein n=1 Tax=Flemingia macrophylla TaxID=520843 RepID=A0ABD1L0Z6_9FABA